MMIKLKMMQLKKDLARQAIKLPEFQIFMMSEMKITDEELKKIKGCGKCWDNFTFTPRSIEKINEQLLALVEAGKIKKRKVIKTMRFDDPEKAIEYIRTLEEVEKFFVSHQE